MCLAHSKEHSKTNLAEYWEYGCVCGGERGGGGGAVHARSSYFSDYKKQPVCTYLNVSHLETVHHNLSLSGFRVRLTIHFHLI